MKVARFFAVVGVLLLGACILACGSKMERTKTKTVVPTKKTLKSVDKTPLKTAPEKTRDQ